MDILELDLTVRAYNCLRRAGITTAEELIKLTKTELKTIKNLGLIALNDIQECLRKQNLHLKTEAVLRIKGLSLTEQEIQELIASFKETTVLRIINKNSKVIWRNPDLFNERRY